MANDLMFYQFSRSKVERVDFSRFLGLHAPDKLPEGRGLRDMTNCVVLCIEGWVSDAREIRMIPGIRRFCSVFQDAWPYWLYCCDHVTFTGWCGETVGRVEPFLLSKLLVA